MNEKEGSLGKSWLDPGGAPPRTELRQVERGEDGARPQQLPRLLLQRHRPEQPHLVTNSPHCRTRWQWVGHHSVSICGVVLQHTN